MARRRKSKQGELFAVEKHRGRPAAEAMQDAEDILRWTLGPNPPGWRVYRLALALADVR